MVISSLIYILCYMGFALAQNTMHLYVLFFVSGIAGIGTTTVAISVLITNWFEEKRGQVLSLALTGSGLGGMLLSPLAAQLLTMVGWRMSYVIFGLVMLILVMPLIVLVIKRHPSDMGLMPYGAGKTKAQVVLTGVDAKTALSSTSFKFFGFASFALLLATTMLLGSVQPFLTDVGMSAQSAALFQSFWGGSLLLGKIILGGILDKKGGQFGAMFSAICLGVSILALILAPSLLALIVCILFYCIGGSASTVVPPFIPGEIFGRKEYSTIMGAANSTIKIGSAIGVPIGNLIFDQIGSYIPAFVLAAFLAVVACMAYMMAYKFKAQLQFN